MKAPEESLVMVGVGQIPIGADCDWGKCKHLLGCSLQSGQVWFIASSLAVIEHKVLTPLALFLSTRPHRHENLELAIPEGLRRSSGGYDME